MVEKFFLVGIDSEWFETYFKTKISKSKIFFRLTFSLDSVIFGQNCEKMTKSKNFGRKNFFRSELIQNVLKRILKRKSQNRKFFPITKFFRGT